MTVIWKPTPVRSYRPGEDPYGRTIVDRGIIEEPVIANPQFKPAPAPTVAEIPTEDDLRKIVEQGVVNGIRKLTGRDPGPAFTADIVDGVVAALTAKGVLK